MRVDGLWPVTEANGDAVTIRETGKEIPLVAELAWIEDLVDQDRLVKSGSRYVVKRSLAVF